MSDSTVAEGLASQPSTPQKAAANPLAQQIARRRTFAIISHPDAGKTTLTEKLLLFGGAIQLAGQVKAKKDGRNTRSDWMAIEKARGISVVTSVMTFEYGGAVFNLLDTPGHEDFSDHTYRTLTAVDSAIMVIDAARGHRGAHAQAVRDLPPARHPDHHLHQQARPREPRAAGAARRDREDAGARHGAHGVADRQGTRLPRHLRSLAAAHPPRRAGAGRAAGVRAGRPRLRQAAGAGWCCGRAGARRSRSWTTPAASSISRSLPRRHAHARLLRQRAARTSACATSWRR